MRDIINRQRQFLGGGKTRDVAFRVAQLKKLKEAVKAAEPEILQALKTDLGKSDFEGYTSEVGFVYEEINHTLKHLRDWVRPRRVPTPLLHQPATSAVYPQPKGVVLIIGPWNYPFQLVLAPLVAAIAAGNCAVLKPSEISTATGELIAKLIGKTFSPDFCAVVTGGVEATTALLAERWDHIFFTGSIPVGRIVMRAAAEHLTPVTLELGGKSPCIVDKDVDIDVTARRLVWGKFYNAGQTCVAPDYLLVHRGVKKELLTAVRKAAHDFFGDDPSKSPDYGRIVSERHWDRLMGMIPADAGQRLVIGGRGERQTRYLAPTVLDEATLADKAMEDEIFGPVLPVLGFDSLDEALGVVRQRPNPLACYVFTRNAETERRVLEEVPFGGGCVNNALIHLANPNMPFGGIGESGIGAYHGKDGFETFSHKKSVVKSPFAMDVALKYPPYGNRLGLIRKLMR